MQFVALLVRQEASRLILKGGMAMRALYGRQSINESRWDEIRLDVAHQVESWMDAAIARAQLSSENDHAPNTDIDLAGR
jgi:hypothetical protein